MSLKITKRKILLAAGILILIVAALSIIERHELFNKHAIGTPIDSLNGVIVYYNGSISNVSRRNLTADGYNLGQQYQCVEFVKRYYYEFYQHKMPDSYGHAKDFFDVKLKDGEINAKRALVQYRNPSQSQPKTGDLVIFGGSQHGHVAIVSDVKESEIEIIQQNSGKFKKPRINISLSFQDGLWRIENKRILGWLRKENA